MGDTSRVVSSQHGSARSDSRNPANGLRLCEPQKKMTEHAARGDRIRNLNVGCLSNGGFKLGWPSPGSRTTCARTPRGAAGWLHSHSISTEPLNEEDLRGHSGRGAVRRRAGETSVTLYGLIDTGISYTRINGSYTDPKTGVTTGSGVSRLGATTGTTAGSRWGLRGKEDLGGGLYAVFQLESGFDSRNGSSLQENRLFGREATIGLGSAEWGEFRFGRQYNVGTRYFSGMLGSSFGGGFNQLNTGAGLGFSSSYYPRYDNLLVYETPSMGGLRAAIGYSSNINDLKDSQTGFATADNTRAITAGLRYDNGPVNAFVTYDQLNASNKLSPAETSATPRSYVIGGSYDFEVFKLALAYNRVTDGWFAGRSCPTAAVSAPSPARLRMHSPRASGRIRTSSGCPRHWAAAAACSPRGNAPTPTTKADGRRLGQQHLQPGLQLQPVQAHRCLRDRIAHQQLGLRGRHQGYGSGHGLAPPLLSGQRGPRAAPDSVDGTLLREGKVFRRRAFPKEGAVFVFNATKQPTRRKKKRPARADEPRGLNPARPAYRPRRAAMQQPGVRPASILRRSLRTAIATAWDFGFLRSKTDSCMPQTCSASCQAS